MATRLHQNGAKGQRRRQPHTTVQRLLSWALPTSWGRFLWRQPGQFPVTAFLLGAGTGGLLAVGLFQLLVNPMNIYEHQKVVVLYGLVGFGAAGWGTSPHIRCASLLLIPKMLGKEGRLLVLGYALAAIYEGPLANLRHNLHAVVASLGCTVELQINNTRAAWRVSTAPLRTVFKDLLGNRKSLEAETQNVSNSFKDLDTQVNSEAGYTPEDAVGLEETAPGVGAHHAVAVGRPLSTQKKAVIFPYDPAIQALEMKNLIPELLETLPALLLLAVLCGLDWALYSAFHTIRHHSFLQYSFRSSHKLEVKVGGDSLLARLLRKTIGALNTSSESVVESSNMPCLPQPVSLDARAYVRTALPVGLLVCLCLLQAFGYRLRRVIAAFYFPKREKKRILFLYNELLRKRAAFTQLRRAAIVRQAQQQRAPRHRLADVLHRSCPLLRPWLRRRCVVCQAPETPESYVCQTPDCKAVYCRPCWDDMRQRCPACTPREELSSSAFSDSDDDVTYAE
uniref:DC-STAMP domain containing 1 n=1 Tax=Rousettus aegyptiacus TaxID=9407 RepID=A0A7J8BDH8_ROUAE|nr:DC-STAMP domain containing 1 [Rousettus aegyptiacus]